MKDEELMRVALAEAGKAMGRTHPNPAVGAAILHKGEVLARGSTQPPGGRHAEVMALDAFAETGLQPDGETTMAVTMEPCSTSGRTGPCTEAILAAGIRKVVIGTIDPWPGHQGRGIGILREGGAEVREGVLERECRDRNLIFHWVHEQGGPFFAGKVATTVDGCMATRSGLSKWITGERARADVHRWRRYFPAIAVGAGTVLSDDPELSARLPGEEPWCPRRFVFDRNLVTFKESLARVYTDEWRERTVVVTSSEREAEARKLEARHGIRFWCLSEGDKDLSFAEFADRCREEGLPGLYVEGGAHLLSSFLGARALHYLFAYRAPKLLADTSGLTPFMGEEPASMEETIQLREVRHDTFGDDQLIRGFLHYPDSEDDLDGNLSR